MAPPLSLITDEQRPDIAGLVVRTCEALQLRLVFGNEEDRMVHIPRDLRIGDAVRVAQTVFGRSVSHFVNAGQVGTSRGLQAHPGSYRDSGKRKSVRAKVRCSKIPIGYHGNR